MKKLIYSIIAILTTCFSCTQETVVVNQFEQNGELKANVLHIDTFILLPRYMGITGDYLCVYKEREQNMFAFFQLPDGSYLGDFGKRGQGPNEFNILDTRSFRMTDQGFQVLEAGTNRLKTVVFDGKSLTVAQAQSLFNAGMPNNGLYALKDSMYLTFGQLGEENEYYLFDAKKRKSTKQGKYPDWAATGTDKSPLFVTYLKSGVAHPDGTKFAAFYSRFKRIRIYDNHIDLLHDINVKVPPYSTRFDEPADRQPTYYIGQPYATKEYIYALCANSNQGEEGHYELQVWTWEGRPVACYKLDRRISVMAVSEKYKKIYGMNNQIDNEIFVYDLPEIN